MPIKKTINQQKKEALKEILRFYNDKGNWITPSDGFATVYDPMPSPLDKDGGELAGLGVRLMGAKNESQVYGLLHIINEKLAGRL